MKNPFETTAAWRRTGDAEAPYTAQVAGQTWTVRVNDWPDEPTVYSLIIDGHEHAGFDDWPSDVWGKRPR